MFLVSHDPETLGVSLDWMPQVAAKVFSPEEFVPAYHLSVGSHWVEASPTVSGMGELPDFNPGAAAFFVRRHPLSTNPVVSVPLAVNFCISYWFSTESSVHTLCPLAVDLKHWFPVFTDLMVWLVSSEDFPVSNPHVAELAVTPGSYLQWLPFSVDLDVFDPVTADKQLFSVRRAGLVPHCALLVVSPDYRWCEPNSEFDEASDAMVGVASDHSGPDKVALQ